MYHSLLTRRYLTTKVMPLLASVAVLLCVATELIVWSVMGGFLTMLLSSGRLFIGDVSINRPLTGFAHYEDLVRRLEADPTVKAAAPTIETLGLLALPFGEGHLEDTLIKGIEPESFDRVTGYRGTLYWKPLDKPLPGDAREEDIRLDPKMRVVMDRFEQSGRTMSFPGADDGESVPAIVPGVELSGANKRMPGGFLEPWRWLCGERVTMTVVPLTRRGSIIDASTIQVPVANEFRTMFYDVDEGAALVRLDLLQRLLHMDEARAVVGRPYPEVDPDTGETRIIQPQVVAAEPARVTAVVVRGNDTDSASGLAALKARARAIYAEFAEAHRGEVPSVNEIQVQTWEDRHRTLISAVKKEIGLVMFIFGVISVTSVFLVLAIFWSMVSEKTRDIGILRALGASRWGVAWLWVRYGLAIGLVGSLLGLGAAYLIVTNINPIHEWLGRTTGRIFGEAFYIWDPEVYVFTEIPNKVEPLHAAIVVLSGILASTAGAVVPALRAAFMRPVRALRFE